MCMMKNEYLKGLLKNEGYGVHVKGGKYYLIDLLGEFVDSIHESEAELEKYVNKNIFEYCS